jgi:hypothetical protein
MIYLYGFAPAQARLPDQGLLGVGASEVELDPGEGFNAVISRPADDEFAGAALERNCGNVEWMAEQGLLHEQVVAWFVDHASIVPSRLLTLFSSLDALRDRTGTAASQIRESLDRFEGVREWDLKVSYDAERLETHLAEVSEDIQGLDREIEEAGPGRGFLLQKKRRDLARTECRAAAGRLARELLASLETRARDVARAALPAADTPVVLNAALLLPRDQEDVALASVREQASRLEHLGVSVHYTGPWAPYRFLEDQHV